MAWSGYTEQGTNQVDSKPYAQFRAAHSLLEDYCPRNRGAMAHDDTGATRGFRVGLGEAERRRSEASGLGRLYTTGHIRGFPKLGILFLGSSLSGL